MDGKNMNTRSHKPMIAALATIAIASLMVPAVHADKKKKKEAAPAPKAVEHNIETIDHRLIDTSKLVWPLPPDVPRIKFVKEVYGEEPPKVPEGQKAPKKKQGWMDRVAGLQTTDSGAIKQQTTHILGKPYGVGVDSHGRIYVADSFVSAVFIFDLEKNETKLLRNGDEARFGTIIGLTVDDADRLFVVDALSHRVAVFNKEWKLETYFGDDELGHPGGIAIDERNRFLYVADTGKDRIAVFDADTFKFLRAIGGPPKKLGDSDPGTLSKPSNVAVDKEGLIYVSDTMNNRIQAFDGDGQFVSMFGKSGDGPGYFARPKGVSIDSDGHIWVADAYQNRVQVYDKEGHLLAFFGIGGRLPGQFGNPSGLFVDKTNRVFVTEQLEGRLQIFQYFTDAEAKQMKDEKTQKTPAAVSSQAGSVATPGR
jgi:DNA-binding beta-propeller fold protein YncE